MTDATVVVVTFDAERFVADCLASLRAQDLGDLEVDVLVLDNASRDATAALVAERFPEVRLLRSSTNRGFAGGINLAMASVSAPIAVLLNADARADPSFVRTVVRELRDADPTVAAIAATVLLAERFREALPDETEGIVTGPAGRYRADPLGEVRLLNSTGNEVRKDGFGVDRDWLAPAGVTHPDRCVFGFSGAAAALRTDVFVALGGFDERFFMYYEDTDLSWRMRLAGYRVEWSSLATVEHDHAASSGEGSDFFRFHDGRNRLLTVTANASLTMVVRVLGRHLLTLASVTLRRRESRSAVQLRWRTFGSFLRCAPRVLGRRRRSSPGVRRSEVERLLVPPAASFTYRA